MRSSLLVLSLVLACQPGKETAVDTAPSTPPVTDGDSDGDGFADADDCLPNDPLSYPDAREWCDGEDNDCDGDVDETFDIDGDGFLADDEADCRAMGVPLDCDDLDAGINPDAEEVCNGVDDDCSGIVDDAPDGDGDGYDGCLDCDDDDPFIYPGAAEAHDAIDNDCSGQADEPWDTDGDGWSEAMGDCDDNDGDNAPDIPEYCDEQDNDCDGEVDEGFDEDGDGYTTCRGDCDDTDAAVHPGAEEVCDGVDTDCDGVVLDDLDQDKDGYTLCTGDCGEGMPTIHPDAPEACNGWDDDCNGVADEVEVCWECSDSSGRLFCQRETDWQGAVDLCDWFGMTLLKMDDESENDLVSTTAAALHSGWGTPPPWWMGLSDEASEGVYVWLDGTSPAFTMPWGAGQPNDPAASNNCVEFNYQVNQGVGSWNDNVCSMQNGFVCE